MGQAIPKLVDSILGNSKIQVMMIGLGNAGKTTILNKLQTGNVVPTIPTVGSMIEEVQFKKVKFQVWEIGGQEDASLRLRCCFETLDAVIYAVDSCDRSSIGRAKAEFQAFISHENVLNSAILVFANKQDMKGAMTPKEVSEELGLLELKDRKWLIQGSCAIKGDGLCEGLDWLASTVKEIKKNQQQSSSFF